jgi:DNA helicase HerA-like ATPase
MEYLLDHEIEEKEKFSEKNLILLGTSLDTGKTVYMKHNPKSERTIISGATGRGKTNIAKLIISQKIKFFAERYRKKFLILDYKGIDWRTIQKPQENIKALHPNLLPFAIKNVKVYTPAYDETIAFPGDKLFSFCPTDFDYEDWLQGGKFMAIGADELENMRETSPEIFESPTRLIETIGESAPNYLESMKRGGSDFINSNTKRVLIRTLRILRKKRILVSEKSSLRANYTILDDLKGMTIPVLQMGETGGKYVQFYSGKILRQVFNARHREIKDKKHKLGYINVVIEEAPVIFHKGVDIVDNPAAYSIARIFKRGRTFGISIDLITQTIEELHAVSWKNADKFIISAGCSDDDKKILRGLGVDECYLERLNELRFEPEYGRYEFMYIGNDKKGIVFNAALTPVGTTEEV